MNLKSVTHRLSSRLRARKDGAKTISPEQTPAANPYLAKPTDIEQFAEEASTRFEKIYYAHRGRVVFKWSHYLEFYDRVLSPLVGKEITLVEVGLAGGGSLQLWKEYLGPQIRILGVDIDPACLAYAEPGVEIMIGDQGSGEFLAQVAATVGTADVVIDDGSHINAHQILTLQTLFPVLTLGGVYVCEDLHTSYWPDWGGGLNKEGTFIEFMKAGLDKIHSRYYGLEPGEGELFDQIGPVLIEDSIVALTKRSPRRPLIVEIGGY